MRAHNVLVSLILGGGVVLAGAAQTVFADDNSTRTGAAAYGDWRSDAPGVSRKITPADMPALGASRVSTGMSRMVARPDGALPKVPAGFAVSLFASGLNQPRVIRVAPNGDIFVAESGAGRVSVLRADDGAPRSSSATVFAAGLNRPFGIAFYPPGANPSYVYVVTPGQVVRFPYRSGDAKASGPAEVIVASMPAGRGHWTRDLAFSADGKTMFVSVGSGTNDGEDMSALASAQRAAFEAAHVRGAAWGPEEGRADVLAFDPDGRNMRIFATGLRNCYVAVAKDRALLVTDDGGDAIWRIAYKGR